jgi:paraquat-inducible protein B
VKTVNNIRYDDLLSELTLAQAKVEAAEKTVNFAIDDLNSEISSYNAVLEKVSDFVGETTAQMENYAEEQGEKWAESDEGSDFMTWKSDWEVVDLEEIEDIDLVVVQMDHVKDFGNLELEP